MPARLRRLELAPDERFVSTPTALRWEGAIAKLTRGDHPLTPFEPCRANSTTGPRASPAAAWRNG
jgi:hypothetical protein